MPTLYIQEETEAKRGRNSSAIKEGTDIYVPVGYTLYNITGGGGFSVPYPCLYRPFKVRIQTVRYWLFGTPAGYAGKEAAD